MKKRMMIMGLTVLILLGGYFAANRTYSWLSQGNNTDLSEQFSQVSYRPSLALTPEENAHYGGFIESTAEETTPAYIFLGKEMLKDQEPLLLENTSGVPTRVRLRISGQIRDPNAPEAAAKPIECGLKNGMAYLGVLDDGGALIPLIQITFGGDGSYWWSPAEADTAGSFGGEASPGGNASDAALFLAPVSQWDLQVKDEDGNYSGEIPVPAGAGTGLYQVLKSVQVVDEMTDLNGNSTEDTFIKVYGKKNVHLRVEYYSKQAEAMEWADWPSATYRMEVSL